MALRSVTDHPKFARLKVKLGLGKACVLGYLEAMWHFTGKFTPRGNIGKYSDGEIEAWLEWSGDPGDLIEILVECGWLDLSEEHRLVVHDWNEHADQTTKKQIGRTNQTFVQTCPRHVPDTGCLPEPEPVPVPGTEPEPDDCSEPSEAEVSEPPDSPLPPFPCVGKGPKEWHLTQAKIHEYQESFPQVDVLSECRKALQWCRDNTTRQKTAGGMPAFLGRWLTKEQNKHHDGNGNDEDKTPPANYM